MSREARKQARRRRKLEGVTAELAWSDYEHWFWTYRTLQVVLGPPIRLLFRVRREGVNRIPKKGPVILVTNHASNLDPAICIASLHRPLYHLGRHDLFKKGFKRGLLLYAGGQIPVNRERGGNEAAIQAAVRALGKGAALAIYPEGGRTPDGTLRRPRRGVGRIALLSGAPCYPVAVAGTWDVWPRNRKFPRLFQRTRIIVGKPRVYPLDVELAEDPDATQRIADELMGDLARLLGQSFDPMTAEPLGHGSPQRL